MDGDLHAPVVGPAPGLDDAPPIEIVERPPVEAASGLIGDWADGYLRACGVADGAVRERIVRALTAAADAVVPGAARSPEAAGRPDAPEVRSLLGAIDATLAAELGLEDDGVALAAPLARVLVGAARGCGSPDAIPLGLGEVCSVPAPRPSRMLAQDLSPWSPRRAFGSLLTRSRPPATA